MLCPRSMKFFYVHPSDLERLKRLLSHHAAVLLIMGSAWAGIQSLPQTEGSRAESADRIDYDVSSLRSGETYTGQHQRPQSNEFDSLAAVLRSVPPKGWRLTKDGWEHVSTWPPISQTIGEIVHEQESREPVWMKSILARVRGIPPLTFGLFQITVIAVIINVARKEIPEPIDS